MVHITRGGSRIAGNWKLGPETIKASEYLYNYKTPSIATYHGAALEFEGEAH